MRIHMKPLISLLSAAALLTAGALAESASLPEAADDPATAMETAPDQSALSAQDEGELQIDFDALAPDNPLATPVAVDPIDKPTPTPMPTPNFWYDRYDAQEMGVSFSVPLTWLLNPKYNAATTLQFVEPQTEMMDVGGYQTRITIEKVDMGLEQTGDDAQAQLKQALTELGSTFTSFTANDPAKTTFAGCPGYYCYYRGDYNDGTKSYAMNGRIVVFAKDRALYQVRLTAPRSWYTYYQYAYRKIRDSFKFLGDGE